MKRVTMCAADVTPPLAGYAPLPAPHAGPAGRCPDGHPLTRVTRGSGVREVCPTCLGRALAISRDGAAPRVTVNDYLFALESDAPVKLSPAEADAAARLMAAAGDLFGGTGASECRRVVRKVAKVCGVAAAEVMGWPLPRLAVGVATLAAHSV